MITYRNLLAALSELSENQLDYNVSIVALDSQNKECRLNNINFLALANEVSRIFDSEIIDDLEEDLPMMIINSDL